MPSTGLADLRGFRSTDYTSYPKVCVLGTYRRMLDGAVGGVHRAPYGLSWVRGLRVGGGLPPFGGTRDVCAGSRLAVAGLDPIRWFALRVAAGSGRTYIGREGTQERWAELAGESGTGPVSWGYRGRSPRRTWRSSLLDPRITGRRRVGGAGITRGLAARCGGDRGRNDGAWGGRVLRRRGRGGAASGRDAGTHPEGQGTARGARQGARGGGFDLT